MALKTTRLTRFRKEIRGAISQGLQQSAEQVADLASQLAPYDATAQHKHLNESIVARGQPGGRTGRGSNSPFPRPAPPSAAAAGRH